MERYRVDDMSCQHCVAAIRKAISDVDPKASVDIDLAGHTVTVERAVNEAKIREAIRTAGYEPGDCIR